jgi:hypothetical protein
MTKTQIQVPEELFREIRTFAKAFLIAVIAAAPAHFIGSTRTRKNRSESYKYSSGSGYLMFPTPDGS